MRPTATFDLGTEIGQVAYADTALAFAQARNSEAPRDRLYVLDLKSRTKALVARSSFPRGEIDSVGLARGWAVIVDRTRWRTPDDPRALWRVVAIDLSTHRHLLLMSNGTKPNPFLPTLDSRDGAVFWSSAESDRSARESLWRPGWTRPKSVLRHANFTPATDSVSDDQLTYLGAGARSAKGADCWQVPLTGGKPRAITSSGRAMSCIARGRTTAWTDHIEPHPTKVPAFGMSDEPYRLFVRIGRGGAQLVHQGYMSPLPPLLTGRYLVWGTLDAEPVIADLAAKTAPVRRPGEVLARAPLGDAKRIVLIEDGKDAADLVVRVLEPVGPH